MIKGTLCNIVILLLRVIPCLLHCSFGHPYDYEIQVFKPTEAQLKEVEPIKPLPLKDTPLVLVETEEQLQEMVKQLNTVSEFAVDLEVCSGHQVAIGGSILRSLAFLVMHTYSHKYCCCPDGSVRFQFTACL